MGDQRYAEIIFNRVYPATGTTIALAIYTGRIAGETANNQLN